MARYQRTGPALLAVRSSLEKVAPLVRVLKYSSTNNRTADERLWRARPVSIRSISASTGIFLLRAISRRLSQNWFSREMDVLFPASLIECLWTGEFGFRRALRSGVDSLISMEQLLQQGELAQLSRICVPKSS